MSESLSGYPGGPQQSPSTTDAVKGEAQGVAGDAASSAGAVGGVAKQEATNVAHEAKYQAKDLYHQSRQELMEQAAHQQSRAAQMRSFWADSLPAALDQEFEQVDSPAAPNLRELQDAVDAGAAG